MKAFSSPPFSPQLLLLHFRLCRTAFTSSLLFCVTVSKLQWICVYLTFLLPIEIRLFLSARGLSVTNFHQNLPDSVGGQFVDFLPDQCEPTE